MTAAGERGPKPGESWVSRLGESTALLAVFVALLAALWTSAALWWSPAGAPGVGFVFSEQGQNLFIADRLLAGQRLYRDVFTQYGPLPLHALALVAGVFGNTATVYLAVIQVLSVAGAVAIFVLLRRHLSAPGAVAWTLFAVFPVFLMPGSANDNANTVYHGFERLALLAAALVWRAPRERTLARAGLLGVILGSMQLIKFGTAVIAGGAIFLADLACVWKASERDVRVRWIQGLVVTLLAFLIVEGLWAGYLFSLLPAPWAIDVLWPSYILGSYQSYAADDLSFWTWYNPGFFAVVQLPGCAGLAICALGAVLWFTRRSAFRYPGSIAVLAFCLPLALAVSFLPHRHAMYPWMWLPVVAAAPVVMALPLALRLAVVLAFLPAFARASQQRVIPTFTRPRPSAESLLTMPNGEKLRVTSKERERFARLQAVLPPRGPDGRPTRVTALGLISGWEHFFGYRHEGTRHAWLLAGFVRRDEEKAVLDAIRAGTAVILHPYAWPLVSGDRPVAQLSSDPRTWGDTFQPHFSDEISREIAAALEPPEMIDDWCAVLRVRRSAPVSPP